MSNTKKYIDSERYRQMLVRDGDRRFQEWHTAFLTYQQNFLNKTVNRRCVATSPSDTGS